MPLFTGWMRAVRKLVPILEDFFSNGFPPSEKALLENARMHLRTLSAVTMQTVNHRGTGDTEDFRTIQGVFENLPRTKRRNKVAISLREMSGTLGKLNGSRARDILHLGESRLFISTERDDYSAGASSVSLDGFQKRPRSHLVVKSFQQDSSLSVSCASVVPLRRHCSRMLEA